jgi:hypothetical protein
MDSLQEDKCKTGNYADKQQSWNAQVCMWRGKECRGREEQQKVAGQHEVTTDSNMDISNLDGW